MKKIIFAICFSLLSCESDKEIDARVYKSTDDAVQTFRYFKDKKTDLCFVGSQFGDSSHIISYVPCTPEVLNLIATKKRFAESIE